MLRELGCFLGVASVLHIAAAMQMNPEKKGLGFRKGTGIACAKNIKSIPKPTRIARSVNCNATPGEKKRREGDIRNERSNGRNGAASARLRKYYEGMNMQVGVSYEVV